MPYCILAFLLNIIPSSQLLDKNDPDLSGLVLSSLLHPYLIQLLCSEIVTLKNQQELRVRRLATMADVEAAVPEALTRGSQFFNDIEYNQAGEPARRLLYVLAQSKTGTTDLPRKFQGLMDITSILQLLVRRELLELVDGEYRFQVELVRRWFARGNLIIGF